MTRIAFSGSRNFSHSAEVIRVFVRLLEVHPGGFELSVGDAGRGLDRIAWSVARSTFRGEITVRREICHWPENGTRAERWAAAHERNRRVVQGAEVLFAFYGPDGATPGTTDAIEWAEHLGIEHHTYHQHLRTWNP